MDALEPGDPRRAGPYRLLRRLGAGGMGRVYLSRTAGGRTVAVKTVRPDLATEPDFRARFRREVDAARRAAGPWTPPVLDADTEAAAPWVAVGYVPGPDLSRAVGGHGPLPPAAVRTLGAGLAEALEVMHGKRLVHRDVKPSNVLLALDGPRLIDFGITRALDATSALTRAGLVVGSPAYLSPEQAGGLPPVPAGDIFSLGSVLAFAATGRPPFGSSASPAVLMYRVLHEEPDLDGLPEALHATITACLAKEAAGRPTAGELRAALREPDPRCPAPDTGGGWLPPGLSASVARLAVELLDLEGDPSTTGTVPLTAPAAPAAPAPEPGRAAGAGDDADTDAGTTITGTEATVATAQDTGTGTTRAAAKTPAPAAPSVAPAPSVPEPRTNPAPAPHTDPAPGPHTDPAPTANPAPRPTTAQSPTAPAGPSGFGPPQPYPAPEPYRAPAEGFGPAPAGGYGPAPAVGWAQGAAPAPPRAPRRRAVWITAVAGAVVIAAACVLAVELGGSHKPPASDVPAALTGSWSVPSRRPATATRSRCTWTSPPGTPATSSAASPGRAAADACSSPS